MIRPINYFLILLLSGFFNINLAISQEVPIPNVFTYGGKGVGIPEGFKTAKDDREGLNIINERIDFNIYQDRGRYLWVNNTSGKNATIALIFNGPLAMRIAYNTVVRSAPPGRNRIFDASIVDFNFYYCFGFANPKVANVTYVLPVSHGKEVSVEKLAMELSEAYSDGVSKMFGTIFKLQMGDTIRAARGGIVEEIVAFNEIEFAQSNRIKIRHADGTISDYLGFDAQSITINVGDGVFTGMPLAKAGGTSKANSADLFFAVSYLKVDTQKEFEDWNSMVYMDPSFQTQNYKGTLYDKEAYVGVINNELIVQEMSRKIKRQFRRGYGQNQY